VNTYYINIYRTRKKESVDPINQSLMVSDVFLFVRLDEPIHRHTLAHIHTQSYHMVT
jgi:hypothetical protein